MSERAHGDVSREDRIGEVLGGYLDLLESGSAPPLSELLERHPDLASELAGFFARQERLQEIVAPLKEAAEGGRGEDPLGDDLEATISAESSGPAWAGDEAPPGQGETLLESRPPDDDADDGGEGRHVGEVSEPRTWPPGSRVRYFGDYELRGVLGQGGMGVVYKARQVSLNRQVALKTIRAGIWADDDEVRRFRNEAEAIANLDHPRIVTIHEVGRFRGRHYFSMKLVEGPSLEQRLTDYTARPRTAAQLLAEIARAVHHAHQRGILHRDLKPSNILLDPEGHPHVTDFGLARKLANDGELSVSGSILGTPQYMSPEQAAGQRSAITTATDVYGLGATLYAALTGRPPFRSESVAETLEQVRERTPEPPSKHNPHVPRDLEVICLKCLEKDPKWRYDSAAALADDLERFLAGEPIVARRAGIWERGIKWGWRHPTTAGLLGTIVLVTVLGFAGITWQWIQADAARRLAAERASRLESSLYFNLVALAEREWGSLNFRRAEEILDACPAPRRGWEWACLKRLCRRPPLTLRGAVGKSSSVVFSPDGSCLATVEADFDHTGIVKIWDAETGRVLRTTPGGQASALLMGILPPALAISPDSRKLAVASSEKTVSIQDVATGREELVLTNHEGVTSSLAFSPDGRMIAVAGFDLALWDLVTGREIRTIPSQKDFVTTVAFSPDGRSLAVATADGTLVIWEPSSGRASRFFPEFHELILGVTFDPGGRRLAAASEDGTVHLWDATTGKVLHVFRGHARAVQSVAFSPDGRLLASAGHDQTIRLWDADNGQERLAIHGHDNTALGVAFSPDGTRLATSSLDGTIKIWDTRGSPSLPVVTPLRVLSGHTTVVRGVAFSPDGTRLASVSPDRSLKIWDVSSGLITLNIGGRTGWLFRVAFAPDGQRVATAGETVDGRSKAGVKGEIIIWDLATGKELLSLPGRMCVAFSPDGRRVAAMAAGVAIKIWSAANGREELTLRGFPGVINSVAFSPDGTRLAAGGGNLRMPGDVLLWDTNSGRLLHHLHGHVYPVHCVAFSPDGTRLISSSGEFNNPAELKVWDARSGLEILSLHGHAGTISAASFSPDGRWIASASRDKTVRIWDAANGLELLTLQDHTSTVHCVAFSPDGTRLASGSYDRTIRIWDTTGWPKPPRE